MSRRRPGETNTAFVTDQAGETLDVALVAKFEGLLARAIEALPAGPLNPGQMISLETLSARELPVFRSWLNRKQRDNRLDVKYKPDSITSRALAKLQILIDQRTQRNTKRARSFFG